MHRPCMVKLAVLSLWIHPPSSSRSFLWWISSLPELLSWIKNRFLPQEILPCPNQVNPFLLGMTDLPTWYKAHMSAELTQQIQERYTQYCTTRQTGGGGTIT